MALNTRSVWFAALLAACGCSDGFGQTASEAGNSPKADSAEKQASDPGQPDPKQVLREMSEFLRNQPAFSFKITSVMDVNVQATKNRQESVSLFRLQRPNRIALISEAGMMGMTVASDGKTLVQHLAMMGRYVRSEAPKSIDQVMSGESGMMMMGGGMSVIPYGGNTFLQQMIDGAGDGKYLGSEEIDGKPCHKLEFSSDELSWEAWVEAGDRPLLRKVSFDLSAQVAKANPVLIDAKVTSSTRYDEWNFAPDFSVADFQYEPPASATEADSLFGGGMESPEESIHPLLGEAAPTFQADDLEAKEVDLDDYLSKEVIILDFWATWCGPCVRAMPEIAAVADDYADRGVRMFAVNVEEGAEEIQAFLESKELDVKVLLDKDGKISSRYRADAIPQTVLIGKTGIVEVVHVGMSGDLREKLSGQLDKLLAGENLAELQIAEAKEKKMARKERAEAKSFGATSAWSIDTPSSGVAVDPDTSVIYCTGPRELTLVRADGTVEESQSIEEGGKLRIANLIEGGETELVTFGAWGKSVRAIKASGDPIWDYTLGQGIDDVWASDLDGDGRDEVIIGYNGGTGLHLLDHSGGLLWKYTNIGNVWHVTSGDFDGQPGSEVITTSARGQVHVFDLGGQKLSDIKVPIYGNMVRMIPPGEGRTPQVVVTGSGDGAETLVVIDIEGTVSLTLDLPTAGTDHVDDLSIAGDRRWAAVAMRGGLVHVVDLDEGAIIATVAGQGMMPNVGWCRRADQSPLLVVATGKALNAFEVTLQD